MADYDICAIGHITNDIIIGADGGRREAIGGAAYYAGVALQRLGLRTLVLSKAAGRDIPKFRAELAKHDAGLRCADSPHTTMFENRYAGETGRRTQKIKAVARPFDVSDLKDVDADNVHLGPLTADDIPLACFENLAGRGRRISLDIQGFTRRVSDGAVRVTDWPDKAGVLKFVHILKANRWEATAVTNDSDPVSAARQLARLGPAEVIVTLAGQGAILCVGQDLYEIPGIPVATARDPTGCGDSFCAGYLFARFQGRSCPDSARFAVALSAWKLMRNGPFTGTAGDVETMMTE